MDNAKLDAAARNANMLSVALYSSGGKDTYLSITNGADVTLVASDRADVFGWCLDARGDGVSRVLVENSSLTARCGDGTGYSRKHGYGIYSQSGSQSAIPRIDIINSNVEVSGNAAAIYAVNQGDAAPCLSIDGGSVVTTPAGGTVRETVGNGLVIGAAGSSTIQDVRTSDEVARSVVISSGDAVEPEPTPQPEPTPAPTPQPGGGSRDRRAVRDADSGELHGRCLQAGREGHRCPEVRGHSGRHGRQRRDGGGRPRHRRCVRHRRRPRRVQAPRPLA